MLSVAEKMIEDVEEGILCAGRRQPFLNVIHDEHVDGLVEIDEVVHLIGLHGIGILHLEQARADIQHSLLWVEALAFDTDGIDQVGLSTSRRAIDEHGIELHVVGMLGNAESHTARQLVAVALDIVGESLMEVELWVKITRNGIENGRRLVQPCGLPLFGLDSISGICLNILRQIVLLVGYDAISQTYVGAKTAMENLAQQAEKVLLQIFIDKRTGNLDEQCMRLFIVFFKHNRFEPSIILLLGNILSNEA